MQQDTTSNSKQLETNLVLCHPVHVQLTPQLVTYREPSHRLLSPSHVIPCRPGSADSCQVSCPNFQSFPSQLTFHFGYCCLCWKRSQAEGQDGCGAYIVNISSFEVSRQTLPVFQWLKTFASYILLSSMVVSDVCQYATSSFIIARS